MIQVGDIVYYGMNSFGTERAQWRVTLHCKRVEDSFNVDVKPVDPISEITHSIIGKYLLREKLQREQDGLPHTRRFRLMGCKPEEATHVLLTGVCGAQAPIGEVEFIRKVDWPDTEIEEAKQDAERFYGHMFDWEWE